MSNFFDFYPQSPQTLNPDPFRRTSRRRHRPRRMKGIKEPVDPLRQIERDWIDFDEQENILECLHLEQDEKILGGRRTRIFYRRPPRKGRKLRWFTYVLNNHPTELDFGDYNHLASLKIGVDFEEQREKDMNCRIEHIHYGRVPRRGRKLEDMLHKDHIERPKFETNWTPAMNRIFKIHDEDTFTTEITRKPLTTILKPSTIHHIPRKVEEWTPLRNIAGRFESLVEPSPSLEEPSSTA